MNLTNHRLLTDENLDPRIVQYLRGLGFDVWDVREKGWRGEDDAVILQRAVADNRVVVTLDADFGNLAVRHRHPVCGIVRFKPGDLPYTDYFLMIDKLIHSQQSLIPPFLAIVTMTGIHISIRVRSP